MVSQQLAKSIHTETHARTHNATVKTLSVCTVQPIRNLVYTCAIIWEASFNSDPCRVSFSTQSYGRKRNTVLLMHQAQHVSSSYTLPRARLFQRTMHSCSSSTRMRRMRRSLQASFVRRTSFIRCTRTADKSVTRMTNAVEMDAQRHTRKSFRSTLSWRFIYPAADPVTIQRATTRNVGSGTESRCYMLAREYITVESTAITTD